MSETELKDGAYAAFDHFDLSIHLGPGLMPWVSASSRIGVVHGIPRGGARAPPIEKLLDLVYDYADCVHFAEPPASSELSRLLGDIVFGDPELLELFQATRGSAADRERQLLVRILASPHLASLPWELLPDPSREGAGRGDRFLALAPDAHVARLGRGRTYPIPTHPLTPPLNLLVALSSPSAKDPSDDSFAFDIFEVKQSLLAELRPLEEAGLLCIDVEDRPTLENLRRRVGSQRRGYHLFHYVGHAQPDLLILEDENGVPEGQTSEKFAEILRLCPDLRLMVFAGCETARAAGDPMSLPATAAVGSHDLLSLADRCVRDVSPVVIGMQAVLPFRTERLFTKFFYQGIATGYSIADSVRLARGATRGDRRVGGALLDWSVPVMFLGGSDPGPLVPRAGGAVRKRTMVRHDLKLGLRQTDNRFFAREVALRQAVDVLAGRGRERVLVVTGPPGVGKTALVDRALEEVERAQERREGDEPRRQVLYVGVGRLAPELLAAANADRRDDRRFQLKAARFDPEAPLAALCALVAELLTDGDRSPREKAPEWKPRDWWDRLVEELTRTPFVIVLDDLDILDDVETACLKPAARRWLARRVPSSSPTQGFTVLEDLELLLAGLRGDEPLDLKGPRLARFALDELLADLRIQDEPRLVAAARHAVATAIRDALDSLDTGKTSLEPILKRYRGNGSDEDSEPVIRLLHATAACRRSLDGALRALADRRSQTRLVLCATETPDGLLAADPADRFEMRIGRLTWPETWRWLRRNLPGLVALGEEYLFGAWSRLGTDLDRWEAFEQVVVAARAAGTPLDRDALLDEVAPRPGSAPRGPQPIRRRGERALRIAAAGPLLANPDQVAQALARLATDHGVGGRVVVGGDGSGVLATVIDEPSPFAGRNSVVSERGMLRWIARVMEQAPDILLLDYGGVVKDDPKSWEAHPQRRLLRRLAHRCLLVAAGGNEGNGTLMLPAAFPEVLAVGPLSADGTPQPYASRFAKRGKPNLYMQDHLEGSPLIHAVRPAHRQRAEGARELAGSGVAALHAVATAVLVWSLQPRLSPRGVRRFLLSAASPLSGPKPGTGGPDPRRPPPTPGGPVALRLEDAVAYARKLVIEQTLKDCPCSISTLSAITGIDVWVVRDTLDELLEQGAVRRLARARDDRFALAS
jgi:hypothetical protein